MTGLPFTAIQALFLILAVTLCVLAEAPVLRWLGRLSWRRSAGEVLLSLVPFAVVIAGFFVVLATPYFQKHWLWTMTFGLPLLVFFGMLFVAWGVMVLLLCIRTGWKAGLVAGLVVFPLLWTVLIGPQSGLWAMVYKLREPNTIEDAVELGNLGYLKREMTAQNRNQILYYGLQYGNENAVALVLDAGADVNAPVGYSASSPRTPLVWAIAADKAPDRSKMVKFLLSRGADPNKPSPMQVYYSSSPAVGKTELPWDVAKKEGDAKVEAILREAGAKPSS